MRCLLLENSDLQQPYPVTFLVEFGIHQEAI